MKKNLTQIRGLYAIVDDSFPDPAAVAADVLAGGCRIIQLRSKKMSTGDFVALAKEIGDACKKAGALFIVNDRADIALACGADGVHLGQDDLPVAATRRVLGKERLIGLSTHSPDEAVEAEAEGADYIGFGPVFGTTTKEDALTPRGLEALSQVREKVSLPIVAIGGINRANVATVRAAGANSAAVISGLASATDIRGAAAELADILEGNR